MLQLYVIIMHGITNVYAQFLNSVSLLMSVIYISLVRD